MEMQHLAMADQQLEMLKTDMFVLEAAVQQLIHAQILHLLYLHQLHQLHQLQRLLQQLQLVQLQLLQQLQVHQNHQSIQYRLQING